MRRLIAGAMALAARRLLGPSASVAADVAGRFARARASPDRRSRPAPLPPSERPRPPEPSASVGPPSAFQVLPPGSAVEVLVAELNLRRQPTTSARRVEILKRGDLLVVSPSDYASAGYGPIEANGYTWYPVIKIDVFDGDGELDPLPTNPVPPGAELVSGWIAADDGDGPLRAAGRAPLPDDRRPRQRHRACSPPSASPASVRRSCWRARSAAAAAAAPIAGEFEPAWLASPMNFDFLSEDVVRAVRAARAPLPAERPGAPGAGSIIRVTVHVDDARSARCSIREFGDDDVLVAVDSATAVYVCREQLVVDSYEVLGTDPDFVLG